MILIKINRRRNSYNQIAIIIDDICVIYNIYYKEYINYI